ncbi:MAG: hypothetical protein ACK8QZ_05660, partial [Anaerolineales bacterium]
MMLKKATGRDEGWKKSDTMVSACDFAGKGSRATARILIPAPNVTPTSLPTATAQPTLTPTAPPIATLAGG